MCDRNTFNSGLMAGSVVARAILNGWHAGPADLGAAAEWADHHVPEGIPGSRWRAGYRAAIVGQQLGHRLG